MAKQNLTIWQRLGNIFRDPQPQLRQTTQYNFDTRELLKTQNKEEYELEKLQKQQSLYLHNQYLVLVRQLILEVFSSTLGNL